MPNFIDGYIDIRLHVTLEEETYTILDGAEVFTNRFMVDASPEIIGWHGIEDHELQGIGRTLMGQDHFQEMLDNDIPNEIFNVVPEDLFDE